MYVESRKKIAIDKLERLTRRKIKKIQLFDKRCSFLYFGVQIYVEKAQDFFQNALSIENDEEWTFKQHLLPLWSQKFPENKR